MVVEVTVMKVEGLVVVRVVVWLQKEIKLRINETSTRDHDAVVNHSLIPPSLYSPKLPTVRTIGAFPNLPRC